MKWWAYVLLTIAACAPVPPAPRAAPAHPAAATAAPPVSADRKAIEPRFAARIARVQTGLQAAAEVTKDAQIRDGHELVQGMHRAIHNLWGFGMLEEWDEQPATKRFNDRSLSTTVEIALNRDGTVAHVALVSSSGYMPFDAAVIDVASQAGPYPHPGDALISANGKAYVHWAFYRDDRQCNVNGAKVYVLDKMPPSADAGAD